jgi:hypothetical protein
LEDERRKLGDEHTSDRFSLELEIERVKRDLINAEDQLDQARRDLTKRDLEVAQMVRVIFPSSFCPIVFLTERTD